MDDEKIKYYILPGVMVGNLICSGSSLMGSLFIIIFYLRVKKIRSLISTLIFCISISEALNSIAHLFSIYNMNIKDEDYVKSKICKIQTIIIHLTDTSTMIFLCIICFCIISLIKYQNKKLHLKKKLFILLGILIPVGFTTLVISLFFVYEKINNKSIIQDPYFSWCWLKVKKINTISEKNGNISNYPLILTIVFYWIMIVFIYVLIIQVVLFVKKKQKLNRGTELYIKIQRVVPQLYNYPIIGSVCWIFTTLNMIMPFYPKQDEPFKYEFKDRIAFLFLTLEGMFCSMRGFFIFIIFLSGEKVYVRVMNLLKKYANKIGLNQSQTNLNVGNSVNSSCLLIEKEVKKEKLFE